MKLSIISSQSPTGSCLSPLLYPSPPVENHCSRAMTWAFEKSIPKNLFVIMLNERTPHPACAQIGKPPRHALLLRPGALAAGRPRHIIHSPTGPAGTRAIRTAEPAPGIPALGIRDGVGRDQESRGEQGGACVFFRGWKSEGSQAFGKGDAVPGHVSIESGVNVRGPCPSRVHFLC